MSVKRTGNWVSQQRVNIDNIRSIESSVRNDFDELLKTLILGENQSYIVRGFELSMTGAVGSAANGLQMIVAEGAILHGTSNTSGTFLVVPEGTANEVLNTTTNNKVDGSFLAGSNNYIGLELSREIEDDTRGIVYGWDTVSKKEWIKTLPTAQVLNYKIIISSSGFDANVLPIAIVVTDSSNNVLSVTDQRAMLFRLGSAGLTSPDPTHEYPFTDGRAENPSTSSSSTSPFKGGDKQINTLKDLIDAILTVIKEIKGTTYWYSPNPGSFYKLRQDLGNTIATGDGKISHDDSVAGQINWDEDICFNVIGSKLQYKLKSNLSSDLVLADDDVACIYLVRSVNVAPKLILTNGSTTVSSVGGVAWTSDLLADDFIKLASDDDSGYYKILSVDSASSVTLASPYLGASTGVAGTDIQYAYGSYFVSPTPSSYRHIAIIPRDMVPTLDDLFWLFVRADNGGAIPRVYVKFLATELQSGEEIEISDTTAQAVFDFIGSNGENDSDPNYSHDGIITQGSSLTNAIGELDYEVWETRFKTIPNAVPSTSAFIFPSKRIKDSKTIYTYILPNIASKFPRTGYNVGDYDGGANHDQLVEIALSDSVADVVTVTAIGPTFAPQILGTFTTNNTNLFTPITILANGNDSLSIVAGGNYSDQATASLDDNLPVGGSSQFPICTIIHGRDAGGVTQPITETHILDRRRYEGGGGSSGSGSGIGSDLEGLPFLSTFPDTFADQDRVDTTETTAEYDIVNQLFTINYDTNAGAGSLSAQAGAGTNITWTGAPSFSVAEGDVLIATIAGAKQVRKITNVNSQTDVDIESAFSANVNIATTFCVSQCLQTLDGHNTKFDTKDESMKESERSGHILLSNKGVAGADRYDHVDQPDWFTPTVNDIIIQEIAGVEYETYITVVHSATNFEVADSTDIVNGNARIVRPMNKFLLDYSDSGLFEEVDIASVVITDVDSAANWVAESVYTRPVNYASVLEEQSVVGNAGCHLYARFFANKVTGKGSVDFYDFECVYNKETEYGVSAVYLQANGLTDNGTYTNMVVSESGGKTRITFNGDFSSFVPAVNPGEANGQLMVYVNGQKIPRYMNATETPNTYYTEGSSGLYIDLDTTYNGNGWEVDVIMLLPGVIDSSTDNNSKIGYLSDIFVGSGVGCDYTTLWDAVAAVSSGQKIIVTENQATSVQRDLSKGFPYEIEFKIGVKIVCDTALASSVIVFDDDVKTVNFKLECTHAAGTTTSGIEIDGDREYHENISVVMNNAGGTITNGIILNAGVEGNYVNGVAWAASGTITNPETDNSGTATNSTDIRSY